MDPFVPVDSILPALIAAKARLTGSRARGDEHEHSDYDFRVTDAQWAKFKLLAPPGWVSVFPGHIGWMNTEYGLIEVSTIFRRQGLPRFHKAVALGREWDTW
jgi:hypothetical protein